VKYRKALKVSGYVNQKFIIMTNSLKIAAGFATGTILGAGLAILFAPKKGSETREIINHGARDLADSVANTVHRTSQQLGLKQKEDATENN